MLHVCMYVWPDVISSSVLLEAQLRWAYSGPSDMGDIMVLLLKTVKIG